MAESRSRRKKIPDDAKTDQEIQKKKKKAALDDLDAPQACFGSGAFQSNQQLRGLENRGGRGVARGGRKARVGGEARAPTDAQKELCEKQFHFSIIDVKAILKVWSQFLGSAGK